MNDVRYHGLDGLRAFAMLLGIVLHATLPYFALGAWPQNSYFVYGDNFSEPLYALFEFIHVWRMPVFFLLAGFFANLVLARRSFTYFYRDRFKRIVLPLVIFGMAMHFMMVGIFNYGYIGNYNLIKPLNSDVFFSFWHLWFLYYLLFFYLLVAFVQFLQKKVNLVFAEGLLQKWKRWFYSPYPLIFILVVIGLLILRANNGGEEKPVWPPNWADLIYFAAFFFYGYGLYHSRELIEKLKTTKSLSILLGLGFLAIGFCIAHRLNEVDFVLTETQDLLVLNGRIIDVLYGVAATTLSLGFIGLTERFLHSVNKTVRWLVDSSYWTYILHLPVVCGITFYLFDFDWWPEGEFLIACVLTSFICFVSYQLLVRYTFIGSLLSGKRRKFSRLRN